MKRKKKCIITFASMFPKRSGYEGQPTNFQQLIEDGVKQHTIRENYEYWANRIDKDPENTNLCLRMWTGQPRKSLQYEIGIVPMTEVNYQVIQLHRVLENVLVIDGIEYDLEKVAGIDGLSPEIFIDWFKSFAGDHKKCILINFTGKQHLQDDGESYYA